MDFFFFFLQNPENPILGGIFGHYPRNEIFFSKIWFREFFTFKAP